ncbi:MAG: nuclear transport factor 2 family protein [Burkholderiales bacterium]
MSKATLERFYGAFKQLDGEAMQACYAPNARFDDEAFSLSGREEIGAMWRMLCDAVKTKGRDDWALEYSTAENTAHWEPRYRFSATGRLVHNIIDAEFSFDAAGLILTHRDRFDFWRWSRQALGAPGLLLGWSGFLRGKVRAQAAKGLAIYRKKSK